MQRYFSLGSLGKEKGVMMACYVEILYMCCVGLCFINIRTGQSFGQTRIHFVLSVKYRLYTSISVSLYRIVP